MKIKNITLLFLLVSSFGNANEKNRDSEGLMLHLYPKNICDDPFALEPDRISSPSEDPFADPNSKVEAADDPFADPKATAQRTEEDRRKRGLHLTQGAFLKRLRTLDPNQFSKMKAKKFAKLTQLRLSDLTLTDDDFLCLVKWMPALENLHLWYCNFPKSSLQHLTGLKDLTKLSLQFCGLGNESMGTLSKLKALTSLNLRGNSKGFTDEGLEGLARLEHLKHLDLSAISLIKGPGLRHLVKLKHLRKLDLSGDPFYCNEIRDEGFDHLAKMTALKKLSLRDYTEFSPESLDKLTGLKNLAVIDFSDSFQFRDYKKGIRPALTRLQKALPDCKLLVSKRFEYEEEWMKLVYSEDEGYDPYDPFALESDSNREIDALLAGESTAPHPEPKKLADSSQNSSKEEMTFNARIGYLSIYASDKPIAFFDGHGDDLEYIQKASVTQHVFGIKEFDASGFVEFSDVTEVAISEHIEDSIDVGISVEVETLEVDGGLAASVSARFTEFEGFSEALGQVTPKFVSREFLFKSDDIGTDERIFIYSDIIKEEHKTMFIVLKISEE